MIQKNDILLRLGRVETSVSAIEILTKSEHHAAVVEVLPILLSELAGFKEWIMSLPEPEEKTVVPVPVPVPVEPPPNVV